MTGFARPLSKIGHLWRKYFTKCGPSTLRWSSSSTNLIGLLTVGNLIGTGVTIGNYLIEWHLNSVSGDIVFRSGNGADPLIQAQHPLVSEPVVGGNLYAVIKYVFIDGVRYSPYNLQGQYTPDLITCLGYISVISMNCTNGSQAWTICGHTHIITYVNNTDPAQNAERELRFDLATDGSTAYFNWYFGPADVADRLIIKYVHAEDPTNPILLQDWIIGRNAGNQWVTFPKRFGSTGFSQTIDLTDITYSIGDYLYIHVIPRVDEPSNPNTNWDLRFKCITKTQMAMGTRMDEDGNFLPIQDSDRTIDKDSITMTYNYVYCRWELFFKPVTVYWPYVWICGNYYTNLMSMISMSAIGSGCVNDTACYTVRYQMNLRNYYEAGWNWVNPQWGFQCYPYPNFGINTFTKLGSTFIIQVYCQSLYNSWKADFQRIQSSVYFADFQSTDPSLVSYYKYYHVWMFLHETCGDTAVSQYMRIHASVVPIWDDNAWTITFNLTPMIVGGYAYQPCDNMYVVANSIVSVVNSDVAQPNFVYLSKLGLPYGFIGYSAVRWPINETSIGGYYGYGIQSQNYLGGQYPPEFGIVNPLFYTTPYYGPNLFTLTINILDINDPGNNWELIQISDPSTGVSVPGGYEVIKRVLNGVDVTIPDIYEPTSATDTQDATIIIFDITIKYSSIAESFGSYSWQQIKDWPTAKSIILADVIETASLDENSNYTICDSISEPTTATSSEDRNSDFGKFQTDAGAATEIYTASFARAVLQNEPRWTEPTSTQDAKRIRVADIIEATNPPLDYNIGGWPFKAVYVVENAYATEWHYPKERAFINERILRWGHTYNLYDTQFVAPQVSQGESLTNVDATDATIRPRIIETNTVVDNPDAISTRKASQTDTTSATHTQDGTKI